MSDQGQASVEMKERVREERRRSQRFPIQRSVRYETRSARTASGTTVDISSSGVLFTTDYLPSLGETVELALDWPARLGHKTPLKLVITGRVVRVDAKRAAIAIKRHELRTLGSHGLLARTAS